MKRYSSKDYPAPDPDEVRAKIIGLGEGSARKSYYPQLREKIHELESKQLELMELVRTLEERETTLEFLVEEKNILLKEVHHRVMNNFQVIGSLLSLGLDMTGSETESQPFSRTKRRLDTMAMVYGHLLEADRYTAVYLCALITQVVNTLYYAAKQQEVALSFDMECLDLCVEIDLAIPLALIVNEAVSNAFDHAFPGGRGSLRVRLTDVLIEEAVGECHLLEIEDDGIGFSGGAMPPLQESLGLTLIDALASQLKATWLYEPGAGGRGLRFRLSFPKGAEPATN